MGFVAAWGAGGLFEIAGVSDEAVRHFSQRRVEIEERAADLVGAVAGELSRERMQGIAPHPRKASSTGSAAAPGTSWRRPGRPSTGWAPQSWTRSSCVPA